MAKVDLELRQLAFITVGTIGPKGKRIFHLQAGVEGKLYTFIIEKEQAWALSEAINEFLNDLDERLGEETRVEMAALDMELREPVLPMFRVAQMGLGYEEDTQSIVLVIQELTLQQSPPEMSDEDEESASDNLFASVDEPADPTEDPDRSVVRMWATRHQMRALSLQTMDIVEQGRPSPRMNGRITYYWT